MKPRDIDIWSHNCADRRRAFVDFLLLILLPYTTLNRVRPECIIAR